MFLEQKVEPPQVKNPEKLPFLALAEYILARRAYLDPFHLVTQPGRETMFLETVDFLKNALYKKAFEKIISILKETWPLPFLKEVHEGDYAQCVCNLVMMSGPKEGATCENAIQLLENNEVIIISHLRDSFEKERVNILKLIEDNFSPQPGLPKAPVKKQAEMVFKVPKKDGPDRVDMKLAFQDFSLFHQRMNPECDPEVFPVLPMKVGKM
jgi:hypothetical protein